MELGTVAKLFEWLTFITVETRSGSSSSKECMWNPLALNLEQVSYVMWWTSLSLCSWCGNIRSTKCVYLKRGATYESGGTVMCKDNGKCMLRHLG